MFGSNSVNKIKERKKAYLDDNTRTFYTNGYFCNPYKIYNEIYQRCLNKMKSRNQEIKTDVSFFFFSPYLLEEACNVGK